MRSSSRHALVAVVILISDEACPHPHLQEMRRLDVSGRGTPRWAIQAGQTRTVPFSGVNLSALERKLRMIYR